ncbi:hypothetical protein J6590_021648 [Homalodisca vitripennis]|nr:hypothetical protein J6590_021648 [Homalodisca vitripennis]
MDIISTRVAYIERRYERALDPPDISQDRNVNYAETCCKNNPQLGVVTCMASDSHGANVKENLIKKGSNCRIDRNLYVGIGLFPKIAKICKSLRFRNLTKDERKRRCDTLRIQTKQSIMFIRHVTQGWGGERNYRHQQQTLATSVCVCVCVGACCVLSLRTDTQTGKSIDNPESLG